MDSVNTSPSNEGMHVFDEILKTMSMNDLEASFDGPLINHNTESNAHSSNALNVFSEYLDSVPSRQNNGDQKAHDVIPNMQKYNETNYSAIQTYEMTPPTLNGQNHINMNLTPSTATSNHRHHTNSITAQHHIGYQSTSPQNGGDGSNSANSSPFTPSPPGGGYDYPTSPHTKPSIPSNTDYPGEYNFNINFGEATESAPKSAQYTYSHTLNKLFVKMNVTCPIRFKCERFPQMSCIVRAIPVFKRPEHVTDVVTRCPNHKIPDEVTYNMQAGHLIRAEMPDERNVRYDIATDGRESVSVLHERPQVGAEYTTVLYKFMCLSSCVGGINRRPLHTVFTLETTEGVVIGRRVVEVRICSCPGRDRSQEEKRKRKDFPNLAIIEKNGKRPYKKSQSTVEMSLQTKRKRLSTGGALDQEEFTLKIVGREKYDILKRIKESLDLMELVSPQLREEYHNKEDQEQARFRQNLNDCTSVISSNILSPENSTTSAVQLTTSSNKTGISTSFTVSNPICLFESLDFGSVPTHSSQPLTATPSGDSTIGDVDQSYLGSLQDAVIDRDWTPVGRDVPENVTKNSVKEFHDSQPVSRTNATWKILAENIKIEKSEISSEF